VLDIEIRQQLGHGLGGNDAGREVWKAESTGSQRRSEADVAAMKPDDAR
jgi:hypothetical protein